jgi:hypothetical protein
MLVSELLDHLTFGELAHVSIGGAARGEITPADYERFVAQINLGLTTLHTRFRLRDEEVLIQKQLGISDYKLHSDFAVSNEASGEPVKYILDTVDAPFQDNVIKVEEAYDEDGIEIRINDTNDLFSIYTPRFDMVQMPFVNDEEVVSVIYRARHEKLVATAATDLSTLTINLHPSFHQALLFFVAGRILMTMGTDQGGNEGDAFFGKYEGECQRLVTYNVLAEANTTNQRLELNGWV